MNPVRNDQCAAISAMDGACRAEGACAANVLAVAIACHRAIRGEGALSGHRWRIECKRAPLRQEARA
jgi:AraC family transcriptional regulator of adaptative response/methylated-DNA-[protein]-cysteine methyltransferase